MNFRLCLLLPVMFCWAFDGFDAIPSQFSGYNVFLGFAGQSRGGNVAYGEYKLQGALMPTAKIEGVYQQEDGMWVNGMGVVLSVGVIDSVLIKNPVENADLTVAYPYSVGVIARRGFLFNPSTMLAFSLGGGSEKITYTEASEKYDDTALYINGGISMTLAVLMTWGVEIGLNVRADKEIETQLDGVNVNPGVLSWAGKVGLVYHPES